MFRPAFLFVFLVIVLASCGQKRVYEHSFYYWQFSYPADADTAAIVKTYNENNITHCYLHYFDVDWSDNQQHAYPRGTMNYYYDYNWPRLIRQRYTPVVFITNRTFDQINDTAIDDLARKVSDRIWAITDRIEHDHLQPHACPYNRTDRQDTSPDTTREKCLEARAKMLGKKEIQIDCDWTPGTRDKYFHFMRSFKKLNDSVTLSATIRLYPYRYPQKMGVPPVDRGLLMCYNLGNIKEYNTRNSVFDLQELNSYLDAKPYPKPLDIALPVFGWYAWFRGGKYQGIIYKNEDDLFVPNDTIHVHKTAANRYLINTDTVAMGVYLREGDELRAEWPDSKQLEKAAATLQDKLPDAGRISFYYWSKENFSRYDTAVQQIFKRY